MIKNFLKIEDNSLENLLNEVTKESDKLLIEANKAVFRAWHRQKMLRLKNKKLKGKVNV